MVQYASPRHTRHFKSGIKVLLHRYLLQGVLTETIANCGVLCSILINNVMLICEKNFKHFVKSDKLSEYLSISRYLHQIILSTVYRVQCPVVNHFLLSTFDWLICPFPLLAIRACLKIYQRVIWTLLKIDVNCERHVKIY